MVKVPKSSICFMAQDKPNQNWFTVMMKDSIWDLVQEECGVRPFTLLQKLPTAMLIGTLFKDKMNLKCSMPE